MMKIYNSSLYYLIEFQEKIIIFEAIIIEKVTRRLALARQSRFI